ncbi:T9SS type A sorting domain-containing protein [uncultured Polaribacter sp.]|uniref:YCF48-related protein n=1 Tax=uncultured Polaribacter sp. TaxID=174711 RepID=UPI00261239BF|nr:T9SS type A sorting domain-containing protein [uncultured Polaribacter sp.]
MKSVLFLVLFFSLYTQAQINWNLENPMGLQNGIYFVESPDQSENFYFFGNSVLSYHADINSIENLPALPQGISLRSPSNTYSAPEPHLGFHLISDSKWFMAERESLYRTTDSGQNWEVLLSLEPNTIYQSSAWFTDVHFPSENIGYAVGTANKIFKTIDGGDTWNEIQWSDSTKPYRRLSNVNFISEDRGFAMGYQVDDILLNIGVFSPLVYYTEDGGQTWEETLFPESDHQYLDVYFADDDTFYLSLTNRNFIFPFDKLYRSNGGGGNWEEVGLPGLSSLSSCIIRDMHWFSAQSGIMLASLDISDPTNAVYRTTNGGLTWEEISLNQGIEQFFLKVPNLRMTFTGNRGIIAGATGNILISEDAGLTWSSLQQGLPDIYSISIGENVSWAVGYGNYILKRNNGIWETVAGSPQAPTSTGYLQVDHKEDRCILVDVFGTLHLSEDNGQNWTNRFPENDMLVKTAILSDDSVMALLYSTSEKALLFYREASDGTQELSVISTVQLSPSQSAIFILPNNQVIVRTLLNAYRFSNNVWSEMSNLPQDASTQSIQLTLDGFGLVQSESGDYFMTTDFGENWTEMNIDPSVSNTLMLDLSSIKGMVRLDETNLMAMLLGFSEPNGRAQTILLHTEDNGAHWNMTDIGINTEPLLLGDTAFEAFDGKVYIGTSNGAIIQGDLNMLSIPHQEPQNLQVFPNPASEVVTVKGLEKQQSYHIYNLTGQMVGNGYLSSSGQIDVSYLNPGIYILSLGDFTTKLAIKR